MRLIKWMMLLLAGFFLMSVFRLVMEAFKKGMTEAGNVKQPVPRGAGGPPEVSAGGELKKCAGCGVYNAAANSVTKVRGGETVYYCSIACRAKAAAA